MGSELQHQELDFAELEAQQIEQGLIVPTVAAVGAVLEQMVAAMAADLAVPKILPSPIAVVVHC